MAIIRIIVKVSLSDPHSNMENATVIHVQRTTVKTELQPSIVVWYGGSYKPLQCVKYCITL